MNGERGAAIFSHLKMTFLSHFNWRLSLCDITSLNAKQKSAADCFDRASRLYNLDVMTNGGLKSPVRALQNHIVTSTHIRNFRHAYS
jgi:hypothetical protein